MHFGEVDAGLLENATFGQDARPSAAAAFALPGVFAEAPPAVELFESGDDAILQSAEVIARAVAERRDGHENPLAQMRASLSGAIVGTGRQPGRLVCDRKPAFPPRVDQPRAAALSLRNLLDMRCPTAKGASKNYFG